MRAHCAPDCFGATLLRSGLNKALGIRQKQIMNSRITKIVQGNGKRFMSGIVTVNFLSIAQSRFGMLAAGSSLLRSQRCHWSSTHTHVIAGCSALGQSRQHRTTQPALRTRASIGASTLLPSITGKEIHRSPTVAFKTTRSKQRALGARRWTLRQ